MSDEIVSEETGKGTDVSNSADTGTVDVTDTVAAGAADSGAADVANTGAAGTAETGVAGTAGSGAAGYKPKSREAPVWAAKPYRSRWESREDTREGSEERFGRMMRGGNRNFFVKKKVCRFCTQKLKISYKEADNLRRFISERGKILPRRITGTCARHQRLIAEAVKRARILAMLPFTAD